MEGCKGTLKQSSCIRQDQFLADEAKKPDAIIVLHILDVLGYGRLGNIKLLGSPGIIHFLAYS